MQESNPHCPSPTTLEHAWIYIAIDMRDMRFSKVGLTKEKDPKERIRQGRTYNPFLTLFTAYNLALGENQTSQQELREIESYIKTRQRYGFGNPKKHIHSLFNSEWFEMPPWDAETQVDWMIANRGVTAGNHSMFDYFDTPNNRNGLSISAMRMIKTVYRPNPTKMWNQVRMAGFDPQEISVYLNYLTACHSPGHPDQDWL